MISPRSSQSQSWHDYVTLGLPEEFVELAETKFREIQEAYEAIKKERGMR